MGTGKASPHLLCGEGGLEEARIRDGAVRGPRHVRDGGHLSRRVNSTKPGVLIRGTELKNARPEETVNSLPTFADVGQSGSSITIVFRPFRAASCVDVFLGLKPQAESYCPFGTEAPLRDGSAIGRVPGNKLPGYARSVPSGRILPITNHQSRFLFPPRDRSLKRPAH